MHRVSLFALCAALLFGHFSSVEAKGPRRQAPIVTLDFQDLEQQTTDAPTHEPVYPGLPGRNPEDPFAAEWKSAVEPGYSALKVPAVLKSGALAVQ